MKDLLRAFPEQPGSSRWVVQNVSKRTEYRVDTEQMTCTCSYHEHKHRACKHLNLALHIAKLYAGDRQEWELYWDRELARAA